MLVFTQKSIRLRLAYGCLYDTIEKMSKRQKLIARLLGSLVDQLSPKRPPLQSGQQLERCIEPALTSVPT